VRRIVCVARRWLIGRIGSPAEPVRIAGSIAGRIRVLLAAASQRKQGPRGDCDDTKSQVISCRWHRVLKANAPLQGRFRAVSYGTAMEESALPAWFVCFSGFEDSYLGASRSSNFGGCAPCVGSRITVGRYDERSTTAAPGDCRTC
jgi:hypothetical protein